MVAGRTLNLFARVAFVALDVPAAARAGEFEFAHGCMFKFWIAASVLKPLRIAASPISARCEEKKGQKSLKRFLTLFAV
jgi:hypothetical protein